MAACACTARSAATLCAHSGNSILSANPNVFPFVKTSLHSEGAQMSAFLIFYLNKNTKRLVSLGSRSRRLCTGAARNVGIHGTGDHVLIGSCSSRGLGVSR